MLSNALWSGLISRLFPQDEDISGDETIFSRVQEDEIEVVDVPDVRLPSIQVAESGAWE